MSSLGDRIASVALGEVGYKEGRNNNNKYGQYFNANNQAWCSYFVMWCCEQAGYNARAKGFDGGCSSWKSQSNVSSFTSLQPGDVVVYVFDRQYSAQHVGIFIGYNPDGSFESVEGNTTGYHSGDGEGVYQKTRYVSNVVGAVRLSGSSPGSSQGYYSSNSGGAVTPGSDTSQSPTSVPRVTYDVTYEEVSRKQIVDKVYTVDTSGMQRTKSTSLLTMPSLVEAPFVILKIGDYTFGSYISSNSPYSQSVKRKVNFPNYMTNINIVKVNGTVNQYLMTLQYQITAGQDPNLLDRIFSSVGYGTVLISYGDWASPTFIYKEEEAIITKLTSNVDFANSKITYQLQCTSNATSLISNIKNFPARKAKPSDIILQLLYTDKSSGLLDVFYGMTNKQVIISRGLIPTNDKVVDIPAKESIDVLSYINFLVTCMIANSNTDTSPIQDSSYYIAIFDDRLSEFGGPYFKIKQVKSKTSTLRSIDTYEVDVGYPGQELVMGFKLQDDQSWALLYNYNESLQPQDYVYSLDSQGFLNTDYSRNITTSSKYFKTTAAQKNWWTNMTQFPIKAELVIKGLLRPAMLMTYVRVNSLFFGQRHVSSGLYVVTRQEDRVDSSGYRTTLQLLRVAGDDDYIKRTEETIVSRIPIVTANYVQTPEYTQPENVYVYPSGNSYTSSTQDLTKLTETQVREKINKGNNIVPVLPLVPEASRGGGFSGGGFGGGSRGGGFNGSGFSGSSSKKGKSTSKLSL